MKLCHLAAAGVLALASSLAACGGSSSTSATAPRAPAAGAHTGTLAELSVGDRACYVVVTTDTGERRSLEGDFELCPGGGRDASALIGKQVSWTTTTASVLAADCEGDQDCGRSDEVELVTDIVATP